MLDLSPRLLGQVQVEPVVTEEIATPSAQQLCHQDAGVDDQAH